MPDSKYQLRYLPKYEDDLNEIIDYIVFDLKNPVSANRLVEKIELVIFERLHFPLSFEPYQSAKNANTHIIEFMWTILRYSTSLLPI